MKRGKEMLVDEELPFFKESDRDRLQNFASFRVKGNMMSPTFIRGDVVIADLTDNEVHTGGGTYVIEIAGSQGVANCMWTPEGISVTGDNPFCDKVRWPMDEVKIIGRVVWYCRWLG